MVLLEVRSPVVLQRNPSSTQSSLSVIEAAYDLESDDSAWLSALVRRIRPFVDSGLGIYANFYDFPKASSTLRIDSLTFLDCPPGLEQGLFGASKLMDPAHVRAAYAAQPCRLLSQVFSDLGVDPRAVEAQRFLQRETGVVDVFTVNAWQGEGRGCCFVAPLARPRRFPARTSSVLSRVARHIAAAQRLRRSLRRSASSVSLEAEAVLDARGAVLHAEGVARENTERELLATTARALTEARERWSETDPEQVSATWNALVDGRWSLVDSFDRDGKRFLLARRNALELPEPSALTPAERQVAALFAHGHSTKLVAYELGLSASSASSTLKRALRKLKLRSRTELLALFNAK